MTNLKLAIAGNGVPERPWSPSRCGSSHFLPFLHCPFARPSPAPARRACRTAASAAGRRRGRAGITSAPSMREGAILALPAPLDRRRKPKSASWIGSGEVAAVTAGAMGSDPRADDRSGGVRGV